MPTVTKNGFVGLVTNASEQVSAPGALSVAENVVIRRRGAVETRDPLNLSGVDVAERALYGLRYGGTNVLAYLDGSTVKWQTEAGDALEYVDVIDGTTDPQPFRLDGWTHAELRGNLYVPYEAGVVKLTGLGSGQQWEMAGVPLYVVPDFGGTTGTGWFADGNSVNYRTVVVKTDANGVESHSAPSGAITVSNTSGGPTNVAVSLEKLDTPAAALEAYSAVEIYRSNQYTTGNVAGEEYQLVATLTTATLGYGSTYVFQDAVPDELRGKTMYASPSRGGALAATMRPPACAAIAAFKGSLFFGNVRGPSRKVFSLNLFRGAPITGQATGSGIRLYTADTTNGSPNLTNLSSTVGLEIGQAIPSASGVPSNARVTGIAGSTVTMSVNATATATGIGVAFYDVIEVDGVALRPADVPGLGPTSWSELLVSQITPAEGGYNTTLVIESLTRATQSHTIRATHGDEFSPPIPLTTETAAAFDQDADPGMAMWSNTDEPENVALKNYAFVGDRAKAVLAMVATRDALFIFKEDGLWRLTGVGGDWRIDPFDPTLRCVLPSSARSLNGRAVTLSSRGVYLVDDGGPVMAGEAIQDSTDSIVETILDGFEATGLYVVASGYGSCGAVYDRQNEYTLVTGDGDALVFNASTSAWTRHRVHGHAAEVTTTRAVFAFQRPAYGIGDAVYTTQSANDASPGTLDLAPRFDRSLSVTVVAFDAGAGFIQLAEPILAAQDDVFEDADGKLWIVTSDSLGDEIVYVQGAPPTEFAIGASYFYRSIRSSVAPQVLMGPASAQDAWQAVIHGWQSAVGLMRADTSFRSSMDDTPLSDAVTPLRLSSSTGYASYPGGLLASTRCPKAHLRSWRMVPTLRWVQSHGSARLEAISGTFTTGDVDTRQQEAG